MLFLRARQALIARGRTVPRCGEAANTAIDYSAGALRAADRVDGWLRVGRIPVSVRCDTLLSVGIPLHSAVRFRPDNRRMVVGISFAGWRAGAPPGALEAYDRNR